MLEVSRHIEGSTSRAGSEDTHEPSLGRRSGCALMQTDKRDVYCLMSQRRLGFKVINKREVRVELL